MEVIKCKYVGCGKCSKKRRREEMKKVEKKDVWVSKRVSMKVARGKGRWWLIKIGGKKFVMRSVEKFWFEEGGSYGGK